MSPITIILTIVGLAVILPLIASWVMQEILGDKDYERLFDDVD